MGKHLNCKHSDVQFGATHPGCMWSMFHVLDYHFWNSIKRMIKHKKHSKEKQARCCQKTNKVSFEHDGFSMHKLSDHRVDQLQEGQHDTEALNRSTSDGQIKRIITNEEIDILSSGFLSVNPSNKAEISAIRWEDSSPPELRKKSIPNTKISGKCDTVDKDYLAKECDEVIGRFLSKNIVSVEQKVDMQHAYDLKLYGLNKRLFHKILNPTDFRQQKILSSKARLSESGSFPMVRSARRKSIRLSSTLKHKQGEIWSFRKGGSREPKSPKDENRVPVKDFDSMVSVMEQGPSSRGFPKVKVNQGWNQLVINQYKHIKQRIKRVLMEKGSDSQYKSTGRRATKISSYVGIDGIKNGQDIEEISQEASEISSDYNSGKVATGRVKRTASLKESLEKYDHDHGLGRRNILSRSTSLKFSSEDEVSPKGRVQRSCKRSLSLPNTDPIRTSLYKVPHVTLSSEFTNRTVLDNSMTDADEKTMPVTDAEILAVESNYEELSQTSEISDDIVIELEQMSDAKEHETGLTLNSNDHELCLTSTFQACFPSDTTSPSEGQNSATQELEPQVEVEKSRNNSMSTLYSILAGYNGKDPNKNISPYITNMDKEDAEFSYINDILKLPGKENISLLKELEVYEQKGLQCFGENLDDNIDNQIIFDLIHEILVNIYGKSFAYFPKTLFTNGLRPLPMGHHLIEEVLKRVNWYLSLMPELDQSLESVVSRDMYREDNKWMNMQLEDEGMALELEDWILDDLLDEIIYSEEC